MASKPVLGYWDARGLGEDIRTMLVYLNVDFEDKRYKPSDRSKWLNEKFTLGLNFPNLPYYLDGDVKLSQSCAILRYLGRKHKLDGETEQEKNNIAVVELQVMDKFMANALVCYSPDCEKLKVDYLKTLPDEIKLFANFLKNKSYVAGNKISYVDFLLHEFLTKIETFVPGTLAPHDNLTKFVERINSLPRVSEYIKNRKPSIFNGPMAKWNATF
uniref:glutathione transferase n=1 Tax=Glycyphagus domesticus TaxID=105145 RepID=Q1M2M4_GLYDO|nr:Gly d 8 [Glycyphagus domesticus]